MISSASSADRTPRADLVTTAAKAPTRTATTSNDSVSTENAEFLRSELQKQPEARPEVVERARGLAADSSYPPIEVVRNVAAQIVSSPDLSEEQS